MAATEAQVREYQAILSRLVRWLRIRRLLAGAGSGLIAGLGLALLVALVTMLQGRLLEADFIWIAIVIPCGFSLILGLAVATWPVDRLAAVRYFDRIYGSKERLSTTLEVLTTRSGYQNWEELPARLLEDALHFGLNVHPQRMIRPQVRVWHGLLATLLIASLVSVWFIGKPSFEQAQQQRDVQQAIAEEAGQLEKQIEAIKGNEELSEAQKEQLTQPLEEALRELQSTPSLEEAVSALHRAGEELQRLAPPPTQAQSQALRQAGQSLAGQEGHPLQSAGEALAAGKIGEAASQLENLDLSTLSPEEFENLAGTLEELAASLETTHPELADQLRQAAQAASAGDAEAAQAALSQASESLSSAGGAISAAEAASEAADQTGQSQARLLEAGRASQQASAQGQGAGQGQGQGAGQGQNQEGGSGQSQSQGQGQGGGAGRGENNGSESEGSGPAGTDPIGTGNGPGDAGERLYEEVFAPEHLGGSGGPEVSLPESGDPGEVIGSGPQAPGAPGGSSVPYVEVFPSYAEAYRQAIESGEIPVSFRSLIRKYFSTLQP